MIKDIPRLLEVVTNEIREYADYAVLGLSGGADSTLVACLCKMALGKENVEGIHMPYGKTDTETFNARSVKLANKLNIQSRYVPITSISDAISNTIQCGGLMMSTLNDGNARSRSRMCVLYAIAGAMGQVWKDKRVRVVGTGNLSEDFIGYDTKGGDALADFFPIGDLLKSEVYQLLDYFRDLGWIDEDMIDRFPSAGLWEGQKDEDELGYSYADMEHSVLKLRNPETGRLDNSYEVGISPKMRDLSEIDLFVLNRHLGNRHKHMAPPNIPLREFCNDNDL